MMQIKQEVIGRQELGARLIGLGNAFPRTKLERVALAGGQPIATRAALDAPRRTGLAASTIAARIVDSGPNHATAQVGPSQEGWYLYYAEIGTVKQPATPFLGPAAESERSAAVEAIRQESRRIVHEAARGER